MSDDIGPILRNWKYTPNDINVRIIDGVDGKQKLQMRLDLGILQMELDGRPDGHRPHKCDSYLSYYERKMQKLSRALKMEEKFVLSALDCLFLQQEAIQFYHRYLALMKLGDFARVARDTSRNLRVFDFVSEFSDNDEIQWSFEQYRPYVVMMHARALASLSMEKSNYDEALGIVHRAIYQIRAFYEKYADRIGEEQFEVDFLQQWAEEIKGKKPLSERERLTQELEQAIAREEYERAAKLRDELLYLDPNRMG